MNRLVFWVMLLSLYLQSAFASTPKTGFGGVARNVTEGPVSFASGFLNAGSILVGASFLFASVIKFVEHRRSPLMVPMSTVVFLFIAGFVLILVPILTSDYVYTLLHWW